ncbi:germination protein, Ger(x)C family [Halobacillus alkaliphilus]|uniref:Germination protein, Ger(X)C family n=1 Tax=Halobacillus alkaliphilus TaxID=396056 RepID=A0A1I2QME5_9BACI|nr:Ger(x)C family spore germination protein [Halobacillus alkaliphilus]SFG27397.1 germination protein, Ger(x)C family [Halobacillus alkaliphilus]
MKRKWLGILICLTLLTGCWDTRQFKDIKLVLAIGFDQNEDGGVTETVSIPTVRRSTEGPANETVQVLTTEGKTPREARDHTDQMIANTFDPSKAKVILMGEELAKNSIQPIFDQFYRNPNNNLNAYIAVVEGKAEDAIRISPPNDPGISKYVSGLLEGQINATHSTGENIEVLHGELLEPGIDFAVPLLKVDKEQNLLNFEGLALFHNDAYSGEFIPNHQTTLLMLLEGIRGKVASFTIKVTDEEENAIRNYLTFRVMRNIQDMKVKVENNQVKVDINVKMKVRVVEYPRNHLTSKKTIIDLNEKLSELLTEQSEEIIAVIQEANSDVFQVGRNVQSYHPDYWKKVNWEEEFPNITIKPTIEVDIVQYGVIS